MGYGDLDPVGPWRNATCATISMKCGKFQVPKHAEVPRSWPPGFWFVRTLPKYSPHLSAAGIQTQPIIPETGLPEHRHWRWRTWSRQAQIPIPNPPLLAPPFPNWNCRLKAWMVPQGSSAGLSMEILNLSLCQVTCDATSPPRFGNSSRIFTETCR